MEIFNTALDEGLELYPSHKPTHVLYKNKAYKIVYSYGIIYICEQEVYWYVLWNLYKWNKITTK